MTDPKEIRTHRTGASYVVPVYRMRENGLESHTEAIVAFVKGSKDDDSIYRQEGFMTETLLTVCKQYLQDVNVGKLIDENTHEAIVHIQQALNALQRRQDARKAAGVDQTYKAIPEDVRDPQDQLDPGD